MSGITGLLNFLCWAGTKNISDAGTLPKLVAPTHSCGRCMIVGSTKPLMAIEGARTAGPPVFVAFAFLTGHLSPRAAATPVI